jgi:hypothetical protein
LIRSWFAPGQFDRVNSIICAAASTRAGECRKQYLNGHVRIFTMGEIGRKAVIFSQRPQNTTFPPLYGLFENGIFARGGGLGVRPVMFRGDVQRTGVEMLADLSPAPAAKYANQAANFGALPSGGSGAAACEPGGIAFRG